MVGNAALAEGDMGILSQQSLPSPPLPPATPCRGSKGCTGDHALKPIPLMGAARPLVKLAARVLKGESSASSLRHQTKNNLLFPCSWEVGSVETQKWSYTEVWLAYVKCRGLLILCLHNYLVHSAALPGNHILPQRWRQVLTWEQRARPSPNPALPLIHWVLTIRLVCDGAQFLNHQMGKRASLTLGVPSSSDMWMQSPHSNPVSDTQH